MKSEKDYPEWQRDALNIVRQYQAGQEQPAHTKDVYKNGRWVKVTKPAKRDDWGKAFLQNMETILLSLNVAHLSDAANQAVEGLVSFVEIACNCSTNVQMRNSKGRLKPFINHIATPVLSREENPDEAIRTFGGALQKVFPFDVLGEELVQNASRLANRDYLETIIKPVERVFKATRV